MHHLPHVPAARFMHFLFLCFIDPSSGTSRDWGHGAGPPGDDEGEIGAGIEFVYTLELRGDGYSFYPPPDRILPSGREIWAMMEAMMDEFLSFK